MVACANSTKAAALCSRPGGGAGRGRNAPKGASNSRSSDRHPPVARGHAEPAAERLAEGGQVAIAATQRDLADVERGFAQQPAGVVEPDLADIVADREAAPVEHPVEPPPPAARSH